MKNCEHLEKQNEYLGKPLGNPSRTKRKPYNLMQLGLQVIHLQSLKAERTLLASPVKIILNQGIEEAEGTITITITIRPALTSK